jgi:hypothetical protein
MKKLFVILIGACICTSGCAQDSGVLLAKDTKSFFEDAAYQGETKNLSEDETGSEQYRVFQQAATGLVPSFVVRNEVEEQAVKHCEKSGNVLKILQERVSTPPHILGNWPRAELLFVCIPKPKPTIVEDQLYIKLTNLKKLADAGTISKDEFEQQKAKILNQK